MEITVKGEAKEIAALVIELQERLRDTNLTECVAEKITENLRRNFSDFRIPE